MRSRQEPALRPVPVPRTGLRERLADESGFLRAVELVTSRGPLAASRAARIVALAEELADSDLAHVFSITDNVGGYPKLAPEALGVKLLAQGQQVIVHLSCKDLNRNGLESRVWTLASMGFENILAISGDYPAAGYRGDAAPVFDLDSVGLLEMLRQMNAEMSGELERARPGAEGAPKKRRAESVVAPIRLLPCAAVSPFRHLEAETIPQYLKMERKIAAGAELLITQTGYDSRKWDELLRYMALKGLRTPVLAGIYVLSGPAARHFHKGLVPGIALSDRLLALVEEHATGPDKGKAYFLELAAKQVAIARGLGFRGAYLSGNLGADDYRTIFGTADSFAPEDWRAFAKELCFPKPGDFYLFEPDPATGLNAAELDREYAQSLTPEGRKALRSRVPLDYRFNRMVHDGFFDEHSRGFGLGRAVYGAVDNREKTKQLLHIGEQLAKLPLFACRDCGDCSLPEIAYLCPESQCAKNQRNGPCGGSHDGICESTSRQCIWVRAYNRLKPYGEEVRMLDRKVTVKDGRLRSTSSWANRFLDRDHVRSEPTE